MLYIRVFSGLQAGSILEIIEEDKQISIGNTDDSNVFLYSDLAENIFLNVDIQNQSIIIDNLSVPVTDANGNELKNTQTLTLPCFLDIAGIKLSIAQDANIASTWPEPVPQVNFDTLVTNDIETTHIQELVTDLAPQDFEPFEQKHESKMMKKRFVLGNILDKMTKFKPFVVKFKSQLSELIIYLNVYIKYLNKKLGGLSKTNKPAFYAIVVVLLLLIFVGICIAPGRNSYNKEQLVVTNIDLKKVISGLPGKFSNLVLNQSSKGKYTLSGVVSSSNDLAQLKTLLNHYNKILFYQVITAPNLIKMAQNILQNSKLNMIKVSYDYDQQRLQLMGIAQDMNILNDAEVAISNKQIMANDIDASEVFDFQQLQQDINSFLTTNSMAEKINPSYQLDTNTVILTGYLSQVELGSIKNKLSTLQDKYRIINFKLDIKDEINALPFKIYSISTGNPGYITTENGKSLFVGGELDGVRLVSITNDKVVFMGKVELVFTPDQLVQSSINDKNEDESKKSTEITGREKILQEELNQTSASIPKDRDQLEKLQKLKTMVKDKSMIDFINAQISEIESDIIYKQKDLNNLKIVMNN